jgi:hypothetical protein
MNKFWHTDRRTNKKLPEGLKRGMSSTYSIWNAMMQRCYNPKFKDYKTWGGRGISVCKSWHNYDNFILDMGKRPDGMSLDRIDVQGDYNKDNCRWADMKTQNRNRRDNVKITVNGISKCPTEWEEICGVKANTIRARHHTGISGNDLLLPAAEYKRKYKNQGKYFINGERLVDLCRRNSNLRLSAIKYHM